MRISKKVWLIVAIVAIVIVLAVVYTTYSREVGERQQLSDRLKMAEARLPVLNAERQGLQDRLTQTQSSLDKSQAQFPEAVSSIEYDDDLFEIADDCNVDITRLTSSPPTAKKIGTITYSVSTLTMNVEGSIDDVLKFIKAIRTGDGFQLPWAADVTAVTMAYGEVTTASIKLDIYGYSG